MSKPFGFVTNKGKFVSNDLLEQYAIKDKERSIPVDQFSKDYKSLKLIQPIYNPDTMIKLLEINTYHYQSCKVKGDDVGGKGWLLEPLEKESSDENYLKLYDFFKELKPTVSETFANMMFDYEAIGYGVVEVVRENYDPKGLPVNIKHIPSYTMRAALNHRKFCQTRGNEKVWFKPIGADYDLDYQTGKEYELGTLAPEKRATEIIWIMNYHPRSDFYGMPEIIPALGAIHGEISRRNYNIAFFDNYGVPAYAVFITGNYEDDEVLDEEGEPTGITVFEKAIQDHFADLAKYPHSTMILSIPSKDREGEVKVDIKPLATDVKEASFRLFRKDNRDEVIAAHRIPPYRIGIAETGSLGGSTAREATNTYKESVIVPKQTRLEEAINREICWAMFEVYDWQFKFAQIDTEDEEHDMKLMKELFFMGGVTPNQIINRYKERFGLEPSEHPAMDYHYVNNVPVDSAAEITPNQMQTAMMQLNEKLLQVAEKSANSKDELKEIIKAIKGV